MHNRKTKRLLWIIGFLVLLIITVSVSYVLGSKKQEQNTAKPAQSAKFKSNESVSSPKATNSNKSNNNSNTSSKASSIPSQFWGTWYEGSQKFAVISSNKFVLASAGTTITKNSLPIQLNVTPATRGSYMLYLNPDPKASAADGGEETVYWIGNLTIGGQKERVLAAYEKQGAFEIFTSHPTSTKQWIQYDVADYQDQIGNTNLDSLKGKSRTDLDQQNKTSKQDNNKQTDSNKDADKNNSNDDQNDKSNDSSDNKSDENSSNSSDSSDNNSNDNSNNSNDSSDNNNNDNSNSNSNNDKQDNSNQNDDN